jgi:anti-anti-sigma factor
MEWPFSHLVDSKTSRRADLGGRVLAHHAGVAPHVCADPGQQRSWAAPPDGKHAAFLRVHYARPPWTVIKVCGELDLATEDAFRKVVESALGVTPRSLMFDLSDLTFIDSRGIAVLFEDYHSKQANDRMVIVGTPRSKSSSSCSASQAVSRSTPPWTTR